MSATDHAKNQMSLERVNSNLPVEVGASGASAQMTAMIQSRFVMAIKNPRNLEQVRQDLLKECSRPSFALEEEEGKGNSALYRKPLGQKKVGDKWVQQFAEGLGIRFAEVAARCYKNIMVGCLTIQESDLERVKYCYAVDLEGNDSFEDTVHISKFVERKKLRAGDVAVSQRTNSNDETTYTIVASEDAMATKEGALISKKIRTLILRLIPGDFQDECIARIKEVREKKILDDPDAALRRVLDGMAMLAIDVLMVEDYLGHSVKQMSPAQISDLKDIWVSIRDGETTWAEVMEYTNNARNAAPDPNEAKTSTKGVDALKDKIEKDKAAKTPPPPVAPAAAPETVSKAPEPAPATVEPPSAPATVAAPPAAEAPPAWATDPEPELAVEPPVAEPTPAAPAPAAAPDPTKGRVIRGVQFPLILTRSSEADAPTPDQVKRANDALAKLNEKLKMNLTINSNMKRWFELTEDQVNSGTMEAFITVIENWK